MRAIFLCLLLVLFTLPASARVDGPAASRFVIVQHDRIPMSEGAGRGGAVAAYATRGEVLRVLQGERGFARAQRVLAADGRMGWVRGTDVSNFDGHAIYLVDFVHRKTHKIAGIPPDVSAVTLDSKRTAFLEKNGARMFVHDRKKDSVEELFAGEALSIWNRFLMVSPGGRFVFFQLGGPDGRADKVRLLDTETRDCLLLPEPGTPPVHFSADGRVVLWGPDPGDRHVYLLPADTLIRDLANLRSQTGKRRLYPAAHAVDLAPDGQNFLVLDGNGQLTVYRSSDFASVMTAESVGDARFLEDGYLLVRRSVGWMRLRSDGQLAGGPFRPDSTRETCRISPGGHFALFVSPVDGQERLRALWELRSQRAIAPIDLDGRPAILINPCFSGNDQFIAASGYTLRPESGVARPARHLADFNPAWFSVTAGAAVQRSVDGLTVFDAEKGRKLTTIPFPEGFKPFFPGEPALFYMLRDYRR